MSFEEGTQIYEYIPEEHSENLDNVDSSTESPRVSTYVKNNCDLIVDDLTPAYEIFNKVKYPTDIKFNYALQKFENCSLHKELYEIDAGEKIKLTSFETPSIRLRRLLEEVAEFQKFIQHFEDMESSEKAQVFSKDDSRILIDKLKGLEDQLNSMKSSKQEWEEVDSQFEIVGKIATNEMSANRGLYRGLLDYLNEDTKVEVKAEEPKEPDFYDLREIRDLESRIAEIEKRIGGKDVSLPYPDIQTGITDVIIYYMKK